MDGNTRLYGILGHPVRHSLSPAMHNAAFAHLGLNAAYVPFPVLPEQLELAVRGLVAAGVQGFNLTVPHKTAILPLLHEMTPQAQRMGAVNTVRVEAEGKLVGTNTDGTGFVQALAEDLRLDAAGQTAWLLGAGGSARAVAMALLEAGLAKLVIANRSAPRAQELAQACRAAFPQARIEVQPLGHAWPREDTAPLLINTTTLGMGTTNDSPLDLNTVPHPLAVVDIIYDPPLTPLLAHAQQLKIPHSNGLGMLLHQGAAAFTFWTGHPAPLNVMRQALLAGLKAKK